MADDSDPEREHGLIDVAETRKMLKQAGAFAFVGIEFVAAVLLGYWVGGWADRELDTSPWLMTTGIGLGFLAVCVSLWRTVKRTGATRSASDDDESPPAEDPHD